MVDAICWAGINFCVGFYFLDFIIGLVNFFKETK